MITISVPRRLALPLDRLPAGRAALLLGFAAALLAGFVTLFIVAGVVGATSEGVVLPRVTVAGVALGGLDRSAAERRLADELPSLSTGRVVLAAGDDRLAIAYDDIGRAYDLEAMLDAAFAVGRNGAALPDAVARARSLLAEARLPVIVSAEGSAGVNRIARSAAAELSFPATNAAVTRDGTEFSVSPARPGRHVEVSAVRSALAAVLSSSAPGSARIEIPARTVPPRVSTDAARMAAGQARDVTSAALALRVAGAADDEEPISIPAATLAEWLSFGAVGSNAYALRIDEQAASTAVTQLAEQIEREPSDASFAVSANGIDGVVAATVGRELDVAASVKKVTAALRERAGGETVAAVSLVVDVTKPGFTTAQAEAALPNMQLVSSWTTYYVPGEGNGWGNNINIPAFDIDGTTLAPGDEFTFWGSVGPITPERGFTYGGAIINGRSTQGVAIGGGICSTSTTIFNAALRYGLQMGERLNHYYYIDRYPDGLDATVSIFDDWAQDMTFTNDTPNPIVIRGYGGNGWVRFDLWSVPVNRSVVFSAPYVTNRRSAIETTQVDPSMAPGTSRRVEFPHDGHDVSVTRWVYEADGTLLHENTYFSSYRTVNGITVVGPTPAGSSAASPSPAP